MSLAGAFHVASVAIVAPCLFANYSTLILVIAEGVGLTSIRRFVHWEKRLLAPGEVERGLALNSLQLRLTLLLWYLGPESFLYVDAV